MAACVEDTVITRVGKHDWRDQLCVHNSGGCEYILLDGPWSLQRPRDGSEQWLLRLRSCDSGISITRELGRHANSLAPAQTN